jgi:hypothetical protein
MIVFAKHPKESFSCSIWYSHSGGYEKFCLVGHVTMYSIENQPVSQRNITSIFRVKEYQACCLLHAGFLLGLLHHPEDGGEIFLQNIG